MTGLRSVVLASMNPHKVRELRTFLSPYGVSVSSLSELPGASAAEETGTTFRDNALIKAREAYRFSGRPAIGDDSGLEVFYLNGRPGVLSARYAGVPTDDAANNKKLLHELKGVPFRRRRARFVAVLALVGDGFEDVATGTCDGLIVESPRGTGGFGYDPLFVPDGHERTFAEFPDDEKNRISHRARAFAALVSVIEQRTR